jgi:hypothetical protein
MISSSYNRHNARSPVPARKNLLFAGDSFIAIVKFVVFNILAPSRKVFKLAPGLRLNPA